MLGRFRMMGNGGLPCSQRFPALVRIVGCAVLLAQLASLFALIFPARWLAQPFGGVWEMVNEAGIRVPMGGIVLVMGVVYAASSRVRARCAHLLSRRLFRLMVAVVPGAALSLVVLLSWPILAALYLVLLMVASLPSALLLARWMRDLAPSGLCGAGCLALVCTGSLAIAPAGMASWLALGLAGVRDAAAESYSIWLPWRRDDYLGSWSLAVALLLGGVALARPGGGGLRNRLLAAVPALLAVVLVAFARVALPAALSALVPSLFVLVVLAGIGFVREQRLPNGTACDIFTGACTAGAVVGMAGGVLPEVLTISRSDDAMGAFLLLIGATVITLMTLLWGGRIVHRLARRARAFRITASADLSSREQAVVEGLVAGESLSSLAGRLGISRATAATYAQRAYQKLGVRDHAGLLALARGIRMAGRMVMSRAGAKRICRALRWGGGRRRSRLVWLVRTCAVSACTRSSRTSCSNPISWPGSQGFPY